MKKRIFIIASFLVAIFAMVLINIYKPIEMLQNTEIVEQINIYDNDSKKSVDISDKEKIKTYVNEIKNLELRKNKLVGNSSSTGVVLIFRDENRNTIETLYTSEKNLIHNHWLVQIINGTNPYEMVMSDFNK